MTAPKVSVLMSIYNGEKHLAEAVESILHQTFANFEFIIIDDGSTDATTTILDNYTDSRLVRLKNETNLGLTQSLNRGLAVARGEYVARMDADDISLPERFARQVSFLDTYPQVALVGTAFAGIDEYNQILWQWQQPLSDMEIKWRLLIDNAFGHSTTMFRRLAAAEVGNYPAERIVCQDYALWSAMAQRFSLANLVEILVHRRDTGGGISNEQQSEQVTQRWDIARHNQCYLTPHIHQGLSAEQVLPTLWGLWFMGMNYIEVEYARDACQLAWRLRQAFVQKFYSTQVEQLVAARWCRDFLLSRLATLNQFLAASNHVDYANAIIAETSRVIAGGPPVKNGEVSQRTLSVEKSTSLLEPQPFVPALVSIIIPTYNHAHFLGEALQSSLAQDYPRTEIIIIDDGSTDNTAEVVQPFLTHPQIKYIFQENRGLSAARNRGFAESQGQYLNFLDADDTMHPSKVSKQVELLEHNPDVAFVYCDTHFVNREGEAFDPHMSVGLARKKLEGDIFDSLILGGYFPVHSVLIRRSALEQVGLFDESLRSLEDFHLWLRLAAEGFQAKYLDEKLVSYRKYSSSMSQNELTMRSTYDLVMHKIIHHHPARLAQGIINVVNFNEELASGHAWLGKHLLYWQQLAKEREEQIHHWQYIAGDQEKKLLEQEKKLLEQEKKLLEQEKKLLELDRFLTKFRLKRIMHLTRRWWLILTVNDA
ncbi:MAG: hypothetical protein BroJett011_45890 [Chloroflexota bacterium]|nr:MAG: hypothetical protein BroJett011_45890 [Chloroflexota bacterium]